VLLYYKFIAVPNVEETAEEQRRWCQELGLLGRIIVAPEGINGTVSGLRAPAAEYERRMQDHLLFADTAFKADDHDRHAFKRLTVKGRAEIVTLGLPVDTIRKTGVHLKPKDFQSKIADPNVLILDIRNDYEYEMGHFRGAIRPPLETFKEFPNWISENFGGAKDREILTYCTGGIRCEKFTAYLCEQGFRHVFQLDGGIVTYAKDPEVRGDGFEGDCFMFDERLSVPVGPPVGKCEKCGGASSRYVNCDYVDCNRLYFLCVPCEEEMGLSCSSECGAEVRKRDKDGRLNPSLRSEARLERRRRHRAKRRLASTVETGLKL
jgi:UPF0176 protein